MRGRGLAHSQKRKSLDVEHGQRRGEAPPLGEAKRLGCAAAVMAIVWVVRLRSGAGASVAHLPPLYRLE